MPPEPTRAPLPGATLARQLARLAGQASPARSPVAPAEVLGEWLDWPRAVALSRALDAPDEAPPVADDAGDVAGLVAGARKARAQLEAAIADDARDWTRPAYPRAGADPAEAGAAAARRHGQDLQHDIQAATGRLRGELRERLERRGAGAARLAAVDAVLEGALAPREHALLGALPQVLATRFLALHAAAGTAADGGDRADPPGASDWRTRFHAEARQLLLAELDLRFQPIEALIAALGAPWTDA